MKKWLIAMTGLCALVVACQKGVATDPSRSIVIGGDGTGTPRLVPPVPDTPSNAQQLDTLRPTLTIRNVPLRVVQSLKALARRRGRSMEQQVREIVEEQVSEREAVLRQIEASWSRQRRRPTAAEVDRWLETGR